MSAPKFRSNSIETPVFFGSEAGFQTVTTMRLANEAPREVITASNPTPCTSTEPGHRVHFIQLKLAIAYPVRQFILKRVAGVEIKVDLDGQEQTWFTHDTEALQDLLEHYGEPIPGWQHEHHLLEIQGRVFSFVNQFPQMTPCPNMALDKKRAA